MGEARGAVRLRGAMLDIMSRKTVDQITVGEVAEAAGVSRTTFYRHYASKYDLMNDCYRSYVKELCDTLDDGNLHSFLEGITTFMAEQRDFFTNAFRSDGMESFTRFLYEYSFQSTITLLRRRTHGARPDERETDCIRFACAGTVDLMRAWVGRGMQETPGEMAARLNDFVPDELRLCY